MGHTVRITIDGSEDSMSVEVDISYEQSLFVIELFKKLNNARPSELAPQISVAVRREMKHVTHVWDKVVGD